MKSLMKSLMRNPFRAASGIAFLLLAAGTASSADFDVKMDLDLSGFAQGFLSVPTTVAPNGQVYNTTGSGRLAIKPSLGETFRALIAIEGWAGDGYDQVNELVTLEPVNADIANRGPYVVSEAYFSATLGRDSAFTISAGKVDVSGLFDFSDVAADQRTQFFDKRFRNSSSIAYPGGTDAPRSVAAWLGYEAANREFEFTAGWAGMDTDLSDPYLFAEGRFMFSVLGGSAVVGLYGWQANGSFSQWIGGGTKDSFLGYGVLADYELPMSGDLKVFARLSFADQTVSTHKASWSLGARIGGGLWGRANDSVGAALGVNVLSDDFVVWTPTLNDGNEGVFEGYYRFVLLTADTVTHRPSLELTPNIQAIFNPGGDALNGDAFIWGLRVRSVMRF